MCLATLTTNSATLTDDEIRNAWEANSDGAGIAYFDATGKVRTFRALTLPEFREGYAALIADGRHRSPMAIHFRLATHGDATIRNVHPFHMDAHTVVCHNGMFPIESVGSRSDTSIFVGDVLPKLGALWFDDAHLFDLVEAYCQNGYANKLVLLTDNPDAEFAAYIVNESAGHWNDAKTIWFSNRSYERSRRKGATRSWVNYREDTWDGPSCGIPAEHADDFGECDLCSEIGVALLDENGTPTCFLCGTCQACWEPYDLCECAETPSVHRLTDAEFGALPM